METTKLSSKGQIIIPKSLRTAFQWKAGQEFTIVNIGNGLYLEPKAYFPPTKLEDVSGCLKYEGPPKTLEEMEEGIKRGARLIKEEELTNDRA